jgi:hypothetical protein
MRILVCGSRHFNDLDQMEEVMFQNFYPGDILIHGDAKGADRLAERTAQPYVIVERYPAKWKEYGKRAGPIRNQQMLEEGKPDLVIAFLAPNSKGTKDMVARAEKAGVPVKVINIGE